MNVYEVDTFSEEYAKEILRDLIQQLDDLDEEEFFGPRGWRHRLGYEDEN